LSKQIVNYNLSKKKILDINSIFKIFSKLKIKFFVMIDGGAGFGETSKAMLSVLEKNGKIFAFEPNRDNHKFLKFNDRRIILKKQALYSSTKNINFFIPSKVTESNSKWRKYKGYSSVGHIFNLDKKKNIFYTFIKFFLYKFFFKKIKSVSAIRLDNILQTNCPIDFVKLDLQGGEYEALKGFGKKINQTKYFWIEYTGDTRIFKFFPRNKFNIYDANYMSFKISKKCLESKGLKVVKKFITSNNKESLISHRIKKIKNYTKWFNEINSYGFIQTDLFIINKDYKNKKLKFFQNEM
jgi:FkbM family methyltransferase